MIRTRRWYGGLLVTGALIACRPGRAGTETPGAGHGQATMRGPGDSRESGMVDGAKPSIVADRTIAHTYDNVRIVSYWRSTVDPRGVVIVFRASEQTEAEVASIVNRLLDAGFNAALVQSCSALAACLDAAGGLANDKSLGSRQWIEQGRPRLPTITVLWFNAGDISDALRVLRAEPPFMVKAAIVITSGGSLAQHVLTSKPPGQLHVLDYPAPRGGDLDDNAWAEIQQFLNAVERELRTAISRTSADR